MFVIIGTTTVDIFISGFEQHPERDGDEFTTSSLTYCQNPLTLTLGGNAGNSAYALASLGASTALCSATGVDSLGETMTQWLQTRGVDLRGFLRRADATSTNTTIMDDALNRFSYYYPGIFPTYAFEDIPAEVLDAASIVLITGYALMAGLRGDGYRRILDQVRAHGGITAIDIGPAIGEPATLAEIAPLLPQIDYLLTNAYELQVCTGSNDIEYGAQQLLQAGTRCVVVKRGSEGALLRSAAESVDAASFPIRAEVTIGAGDTFNAGFLYGVHEAMSAYDCLRFGNATAAAMLASGKTILGAPALAEVQALLHA